MCKTNLPLLWLTVPGHLVPDCRPNLCQSLSQPVHNELTPSCLMSSTASVCRPCHCTCSCHSRSSPGNLESHTLQSCKRLFCCHRPQACSRLHPVAVRLGIPKGQRRCVLLTDEMTQQRDCCNKPSSERACMQTARTSLDLPGFSSDMDTVQLCGCLSFRNTTQICWCDVAFSYGVLTCAYCRNDSPILCFMWHDDK